MKKLILAALCCVAVFSLSGCKSEKAVLHGTVVEINGDIMLVKPDEGTEEAKSADRFSVSAASLTDEEKPAVGDSVEITYSGYIREVYPADLDGVESITVKK